MATAAMIFGPRSEPPRARLANPEVVRRRLAGVVGGPDEQGSDPRRYTFRQFGSNHRSKAIVRSVFGRAPARGEQREPDPTPVEYCSPPESSHDLPAGNMISPPAMVLSVAALGQRQSRPVVPPKAPDADRGPSVAALAHSPSTRSSANTLTVAHPRMEAPTPAAALLRRTHLATPSAGGTGRTAAPPCHDGVRSALLRPGSTLRLGRRRTQRTSR